MNDIFHRLFRTLYPHKDVFEVKREYSLPKDINLSIRFGPDGWFVATSPDLPGLITQARNQQELIEMVNDSVLTYFDVPKKEADIVYDHFNLNGQTIRYEGRLQTKPA